MQSRIEVGLFDGSFQGQQTANVRASSWAQFPKYFKWMRGEFRNVTVFTDMFLFSEEAMAETHGTKIAWILEPDVLDRLNEDEFDNLEGTFDFIFTSDLSYIEAFDRYQWKYVPTGGLWVAPRSYQEKSDVISMMTTQKKKAPGHRLRKEIMDAYNALDNPGFKIEFFGRGSNPIEDKTTAIGPYRYTIVVESYQIPGYFTEKIVDAFASYTVPIYWGDSRIHDRFAKNGMMLFDSIDYLFELLSDGHANKDFYDTYFNHVCANFKLAQRYYCAEDWMFEEYPYLFT